MYLYLFENGCICVCMYIYIYVYLLHIFWNFKITGDPCKLVGFDWSNFFTNCTIFCTKSHLFCTAYLFDFEITHVFKTLLHSTQFHYHFIKYKPVPKTLQIWIYILKTDNFLFSSKRDTYTQKDSIYILSHLSTWCRYEMAQVRPFYIIS